MLRAYFLDCDFYPKILFVGDKPDIVPLLDIFDEFIDFGKIIHIQDHPQLSLQNFNLALMLCEEQEQGILKVTDQSFVWHISLKQAQDYYLELEELLCQPEQSGSHTWEMRRLDEIKVKISMNEFDDSYLQD